MIWEKKMIQGLIWTTNASLGRVLLLPLGGEPTAGSPFWGAASRESSCSCN